MEISNPDQSTCTALIRVQSEPKKLNATNENKQNGMQESETIPNLKAKIKKMEDDLQAYEDQFISMKKMKKDITEKDAEIKNLKVKIENLQAKIENLQAKIENLQKELSSFKQDLQKLEEEKRQLKEFEEENKQLKEDFSKLKAKGDPDELRAYIEDLKQGNAKCTLLLKENADLESRLHTKELEKEEEAAKFIKEKAELNEKIKDLEVKWEQLKTQIDTLTKEKAELSTENKSLLELNESLAESNKNFEGDSAQNHQAQIENLKEQLVSAQKEKQESDRRMKENNQKHMTQLENLSKDYENTLSNLEAQNHKLLQEVEEKKSEIQRLTKNREDNMLSIKQSLEVEIKKMDDENKILQSNNQKGEKEVESLKASAAKMKTENEVLVAKIKNMETEKLGLEQSLKQLNSKISEITNEKENYSSTVTKLQQEKTTLTKAMEDLLTEVSMLKDSNKTSASKIKELEDLNSTLNKSNKNLNNIIPERDNRIKALSSQVELLEKEKASLDQLNAVHKTTIEKISTESKKLLLEIKRHEDEKSQLKKDKEELSSTIAVHKTTIEKINNENKKLLLEIKRHEDEKSQLKKDKEELRSAIIKMEKDYQAKIEVLTDEKTQLQKNFDEKESKQNSIISKLKQEYTSLDNARKNLDQELKAAMKKLQTSIVFKAPVYDVSIAYQSIMTPSIYALPDAGWLVSSQKNIKERMERKSPIIGLLGPACGGKKWLSTKLSECGLPKIPQSSSIALFYPQPDKGTVGFLINSSWNQSICPNSRELQGLLPPTELTDDALRRRDYALLYDDVKIIEEIKTRFTVNTAGLSIVVVSSISQADFDMLMMIKRLRRASEKQQAVIIVHNFSHLKTRKQVETEIEDNLEKKFFFNKQPIFNEKDSKFLKKSTSEHHESLYKDEFSDVHLIMASDDTEAGRYYNPMAIEFLCSKIENLEDKLMLPLCDQFAKFCTEEFSRRISKVVLEFDLQRSKIVSAEKSKDAFRQIRSDLSDNPFIQEGFKPAYSVVKRIEKSTEIYEITIEAIDTKLEKPTCNTVSGQKFFVLRGEKSNVFSDKEMLEETKNTKLVKGTRGEGTFELKVKLPFKRCQLVATEDIGSCMKKYKIECKEEEQSLD